MLYEKPIQSVKKKIILMYDFFSEQGGIERIMHFQAKTLRKRGYDVKFAFAYVEEGFRNERLADFNVIEYGKLSKKSETLQICLSTLRNSSTEKMKDADLIICHSFPASYVARKVQKKFGIPYIMHLHHPPKFLYDADQNWASNSFKRKFSFLLGKALRKPLRKIDTQCVLDAKGYLIESESVQRKIQKAYNVKGTVTYPTIDPLFTVGKPDLEKIKKRGIKTPFIFGAGRIVKQKRYDCVIEALSKANSTLPLVLAGGYSQEMRTELETLANAKNVAIHFLGALDPSELMEFYRQAKLLVSTCPNEGFGLVISEAMACGCPVVAWDGDHGPKEIIVNGLNGYLAKPLSIQDLSHKINMTLGKKWYKLKIVKSVEKFSEKNVEKLLVSEVEKVLNQELN